MKLPLLLLMVLAVALSACGKESPSATSPATAVSTSDSRPAGIPASPEVIAKFRQTIKIDGLVRTYVIHVPASVRASRQPVPLVVLLHGATDDGVYAYAAYGFPELAEKENFVAVFPDGISNMWDAFQSAKTGASRDDAFLNALLAAIKKEWPIDPRQVYLCGHSNGAMMAGAYGARHADQIAALGLVAGSVGWETATERVTIPRPQRAIPVMIVHGMKDPNLPFAPPQPGAEWQAISPEDSAAFWAVAEKLSAPVDESLSSRRVRHSLYTSDGGKLEITTYFLTEGNHMWPGGRAMPGKTQTPSPDLATTEIMWGFFKRHPL